MSFVSSLSGIEGVYLADVDGPQTQTPVRVSGTPQANGYIDSHAWAPNGRWIAYIADQDVDEVDQAYATSIVAGVPGTAVALSPSPVANGDAYELFFGPSGQHLVVQGDLAVDGRTDAFAVDLGAANPATTWRRLTVRPGSIGARDIAFPLGGLVVTNDWNATTNPLEVFDLNRPSQVIGISGQSQGATVLHGL